ncbi:MAG: glycyl-radical enzyme activating protein [Draconibacterium sp.]|nr:glycyl-radical enzyme activating protein [Draconibacterium sp.]
MQQADKGVKGRIFKIESLNTHNGPGYRTVIYLKGCPLNCLWCHNPESISQKKEIWVLHSKCIGCLSCVEACPQSALSMQETGIEVDRNKCVGCYTCVDVCPSKAIEKLGEDYTVSEVFDRILKDKLYLEASGGGITVTGGEPGIAPEFVSQLFQKCREEGIHTAFDTSGFISKEALEMIIPFTDLVFFDLKVMEEKAAKKMIGQGTSRIFESLDWIKSYKIANSGPELQFRTPIIPGATDSSENLNAIVQIIKDKYDGLFTEWELNLFNDICEDKYQRLNKKWHFSGAKFDSINYQKLEEFSSNNPELKIKISGFVQKRK